MLRDLEEVPEQPRALRYEYRFGVELDSLDRQLTVANAHDRLIVGARRYVQPIRPWFIGHDKGVIARGFEVLRKTLVHALPVVSYAGQLSVPRPDPGTVDPAPESFTNALVTEAYTENGNPASKSLDCIDRDARVGGRTGTRGNNDGVRLHGSKFADRGIVADDNRLGSDGSKSLREVVDERIEVIDQKKTHGNS